MCAVPSIIIIIIIIIIIDCNWVFTRWQWLIYKNTIYKIAAKFTSEGPHEKLVVATWNVGSYLNISFRHRETKKNLCRGGRSEQDLPDTDC
jgi:hypothetical protein